ncbi:MAG TPA: hypothetical protein VMU13_02435 [Candidatus Paceibacterota bacterium]|nr:hypothetical protein [Candidatus Paceibacterota bacterium]
MQYIHQTTYGHAGAFHTAKPLFAMQNNHLFEMKNGRPDVKAVYAIRDNKIYSTPLHPNGESPHALYEIKGNHIHTTAFHPNHNPNQHAFEIKSSM